LENAEAADMTGSGDGEQIGKVLVWVRAERIFVSFPKTNQPYVIPQNADTLEGLQDNAP
jgi:hypothetical protein